MTQEEKIELIAEIMDVEADSLTPETELSEIEEWDSLAALSLTLEIKKRQGEQLTTDALQQLKTIGDICALFN